jgi:signal transduction histidine kinase
MGPNEEVRGFFFMGVDVTSRRRVEEELFRSQQVLEVITREQQRISHDLHDTVGQELTGLSFMAKKLAQKLEALQLEEARSATTIAEGIKRAISKVRKAIKGVVPVEVDAKGLMVALEHLALGTREQYSIDCHFECGRPVEVEDRDTATHLFRIAQEAVNNAVKHGEATRIVIRLESDPKALRLSVMNDGLTIEDGADEDASGIGVRIMHFRAGVIGAQLRIEPAPQGGTIVHCKLARESEQA